MEQKAYNNNLAYIAGYPLEFLLKIATCIAGDFQKGHIGDKNRELELFDFYMKTANKNRTDCLLDIAKLKRMGLAQFDVNEFRYRAT